MPARTKKRPIENRETATISVRVGTAREITVPKRFEKDIANFVRRLARSPAEDYMTAEEVFAPLNKKYTRPGAMLLGARTRDGLTQKKLAEKLGVSQPNVAAMESGRRPIGKEMAKRLAAIFKTDYRAFL